MHKIMALDVGTKRIGVALSDFLQILATGHCVVDRRPEESAVKKLKEIALSGRVETIIIGLPYNMDGTKGSQADDCMEFAKNFQGEFNVVFEDERLTSELAEENLREKKINYKSDKGLVDIESACIILEQYLARVKN